MYYTPTWYMYVRNEMVPLKLISYTLLRVSEHFCSFDITSGSNKSSTQQIWTDTQ